MIALDRAAPVGPYVLVDRRTDGRPRELQRFTDPGYARTALELLRAAGDQDAELRLVESVDPLKEPA